MLQANIRPHFFFKTLNTVASLIMIDPEKAEKMLMDLAQLFRAVLKNDEALVSFEQEIELAKRYLEIEQVRQIGRASCREKSVDLGGRRIIKEKKNIKRKRDEDV